MTDELTLGYAEAVAELDVLLHELDDDDLDLDVLATKVARASTLLAHCRGRLEAARLQVEQVVAGIEAGTDAE